MRRHLSYLDGIGAALAVLSIVALIWMAVYGGNFARLYSEFSKQPPVLTKIALHPAWRIGVVAAVSLTLVLAHVWRTRLALFVLGLVASTTVVLTYAAVYRPIWAMAGHLRSDVMLDPNF